MDRRRGLVLVLAPITGLVLAAPPAAGAADPPRNGNIAFESERSGNPDIWSMHRNGDRPVNLTEDSPAVDALPDWSPDGTRIAFMSDRTTPGNPPVGTDDDGPFSDFELFVMGRDGSDVRQVTRNRVDDEFPSWSPDGTSLVFMRDFEAQRGIVDYDLFTVRADGSRERNITRSPGVDDVEPDWSPDGRSIAFTIATEETADIWTMRADGTRKRQLTRTEDAGEFGAAWSPDGRRIAFDSDRDRTPETEFQVDVYVMTATGADQTRLTDHPFTDIQPEWSPDGRKIVFTSFRGNEGTERFADLHVMDADGSDVRRLTSANGFDGAASWQRRPSSG